MNTKSKLDRQVVLTISVLLTAMWLPLTTFAQGFPKADDLTHGTQASMLHESQDFRRCQHPHDPLTFLSGSNNWISKERVGFAETDPANQETPDALTVLQTSNSRVQQVGVGFAETNPTAQQSPGVVTNVQASNNREQQAFAGFAETEPAAELFLSGEEIHNQVLVPCPRDHGKKMVHGKPAFSNLTEEGTQHDHS